MVMMRMMINTNKRRMIISDHFSLSEAEEEEEDEREHQLLCLSVSPSIDIYLKNVFIEAILHGHPLMQLCMQALIAVQWVAM